MAVSSAVKYTYATESIGLADLYTNSGKMMIAKIALPLLMFAVMPLCAQTVYKCKDTNGNAVFSQSPCSKDADSICLGDDGKAKAGPCEKKQISPYAKVLQDDQPATQQSSQAATISAASQAKKKTALEAINDEVADNDCRRGAANNHTFAGDEHLQILETRRSQLTHDLLFANNNLPGAVYEQGVRKQIGDIEVAITQERMRITQANADSDRTYAESIRRCDAEKAKRAQN